MIRPIVRTLTPAVVLLAVTVGAAFGQSSDSRESSAGFKEPPVGLGYSYDGPSQWNLDSQGKSTTSRQAPAPAPVTRNLPSGRWNAPVVPARPRRHSAFDESLTGADAASSQDDTILAPQRSTHADSYRPPIGEEPVLDGADGDGPEPSWTESAVAKFNSAKQAVVGGWNWMAIEANESFGVTSNRPDRRRFRPLCPGCGRRHFQRQ